MKKNIVLVIFMLSLGVVNGATPSLLFSKSDISALKAKIKSPKFKDEWKAYISEADDLCNPDSNSYADPEKVTEGLDKYEFDIRGHMCGRRLTGWMQNLGLVYQLTGGKKYREHGIAILVNHAKIMTIKHPFHAKGFPGGKGDFMRGLAIGYDMFGESLTYKQRELIFKTAKDYVDNYLAEFENTENWCRPYHNFVSVCGSMAGCLSLQMRDHDKKLSDAYVSRVTYLLKDWLWNGFDEEGAYFEGIDYATYGLGNTIIFADALKRSGGEDLFEHPRLKKLVNWYAMSVLPGERVMDARNDSPYVNPGDILLKLASEHKNGVDTWLYSSVENGENQSFFLSLLWSNDIKPVSPAQAGIPLAEHFRGRGLCVWRTGWEKNDVMFAIEAGQYHAVTHNQADKGHFTLYGFGYRWACDSGYGCNREPEGRCQTVAHNCVLIDGKGQGISGASWGTNGRILAYDNNDTYGYALADCTEAYRNYITAENKTESSCGVSHFNMEMDHAYRHTFFVRKTSTNPAYAVILDDVEKDKAEHEYCWQMQSWPDLGINLADPNMVVIFPKDAQNANKSKMFVFMDSDSSIRLKQEDYEVKPADGRVNPSYPRLRGYSKAVNPYFVAVLVPTDGSVNPPKVKFDKSVSEETICIEWPKRMDKIVWKKDGKAKPELSVSKR